MENDGKNIFFHSTVVYNITHVYMKKLGKAKVPLASLRADGRHTKTRKKLCP